MKDCYETGREMIEKIHEDAAEKIIKNLNDLDPDLARLTVEFAYGNIYSRLGLDIKSREIAAVAALAAMGNAKQQLKLHINSALNAGCSKTEIIEIMVQTAVYAGFPAALNGMHAAKEVLKDRGIL